MFIQTQDTPNPNTIKFILPELLLPDTSVSLTRGSDNLRSFPVAIKLFEIEEVHGIFINHNFISVTKEETAQWEVLKTMVLSYILDMTSKKLPLVNLADKTKAKTPAAPASAENDVADSIENQIKELIETRVRPAVAQDGGDILFHAFKDGIVYLELHGACSGCPSSTITLKNGIENMLKHYIPEVQSVESV